MAKELMYSISLLLMLTSYGNAQNCNYQMHLQSGQAAIVHSPDYPDNSSGARSCRWTATSDNRVKLICGEFNLPSSDNCEESVLKVYAGRSDIPKRYCDDRPFSVESSDGEIIIEYESRNSSRPGKFLCYVQVIEKTQYSDSCRCGYKNTTENVGGNETEITEYPMIAGIISSETYELICSATIISNKYALTAADCVINKDPKTIGLLVGELNISTDSETNATKSHQIENLITDPQDSNNNIAIVVIEGTIEFTNEVSPACLPFQHQRNSFAGSFLEILGLKSTIYNGEKSFVLYRAIVSALTNAECKHNYYNDLSDVVMCTSSVEDDTYELRIGGPALWRNPTTGKMVLAGIFTSGGVETSNMPGLIPRVGDYLDWITFNTPDAEYCEAE